MRESRNGCLGIGRKGVTTGEDYKRTQRNFWGDRYVHYVDCSDGFTSVKTYQIACFKYVQFTVYVLYILKYKVFKKESLCKSHIPLL